MSSADSSHAITMMESVALTDSRVVEDIDYVIVDADNMDVDDDDSYDYCEDVISMQSSASSSSLSVCSDLPSIDHCSLYLETTKEEVFGRRPRLISFGNDEDEAQGRMERYYGPAEIIDETEEIIDEFMSEEKETESTGTSIADSSGSSTRKASTNKATATNQQPDASSGSRLSNKKRRKKMKLMKKAAAAAAAAAALTDINRTLSRPTRIEAPKPVQKPKVTSVRSKKVANIAVACATETMDAYRQELRNKKKEPTNFLTLV